MPPNWAYFKMRCGWLGKAKRNGDSWILGIPAASPGALANGSTIRGTLREVPLQNIFVAAWTAVTTAALALNVFGDRSFLSEVAWCAGNASRDCCWGVLSGVPNKKRTTSFQMPGMARDPRFCAIRAVMWVGASSENVNESDKSVNEPSRERPRGGWIGMVRGSFPSWPLLGLSAPDGEDREDTIEIHFSYAIHADTTTRPNEVAAVQPSVRMEVYRFFKKLSELIMLDSH